MHGYEFRVTTLPWVDEDAERLIQNWFSRVDNALFAEVVGICSVFSTIEFCEQNCNVWCVWTRHMMSALILLFQVKKKGASKLKIGKCLYSFPDPCSYFLCFPPTFFRCSLFKFQVHNLFSLFFTFILLCTPTSSASMKTLWNNVFFFQFWK